MSDLATRLADLASRGETLTYGALARDMGWRVQELTTALETLMDADAAAGQPLRAALCEGRLAGGLPAPGFFLKAAALGFDVSDPAGFVARQRTGLFSARS